MNKKLRLYYPQTKSSVSGSRETNMEEILIMYLRGSKRVKKKQNEIKEWKQNNEEHEGTSIFRLM